MLHILNSETRRPKCQKAFNKVTAQNFECIDVVRFAEMVKTQPKVCCKKCQKLI